MRERGPHVHDEVRGRVPRILGLELELSELGRLRDDSPQKARMESLYAEHDILVSNLTSEELGDLDTARRRAGLSSEFTSADDGAVRRPRRPFSVRRPWVWITLLVVAVGAAPGLCLIRKINRDIQWRRQRARMALMEKVAKAMNTYVWECKYYPTSLDDLHRYLPVLGQGGRDESTGVQFILNPWVAGRPLNEGVPDQVLLYEAPGSDDYEVHRVLYVAGSTTYLPAFYLRHIKTFWLLKSTVDHSGSPGVKRKFSDAEEALQLRVIAWKRVNSIWTATGDRSSKRLAQLKLKEAEEHFRKCLAAVHEALMEGAGSQRK